MGKRFTEYSQFDLSQVNKDVLKKWDENQVFAKSMTERDGCPSFVFFEGPPSANGMPGILQEIGFSYWSIIRSCRPSRHRNDSFHLRM